MDKLIPTEVYEALMRYLANRPWHEVQQVMPTLMNLPDAPKMPEQPND